MTAVTALTVGAAAVEGAAAGAAAAELARLPELGGLDLLPAVRLRAPLDRQRRFRGSEPTDTATGQLQAGLRDESAGPGRSRAYGGEPTLKVMQSRFEASSSEAMGSRTAAGDRQSGQPAPADNAASAGASPISGTANAGRPRVPAGRREAQVFIATTSAPGEPITLRGWWHIAWRVRGDKDTSDQK